MLCVEIKSSMKKRNICIISYYITFESSFEMYIYSFSEEVKTINTHQQVKNLSNSKSLLSETTVMFDTCHRYVTALYDHRILNGMSIFYLCMLWFVSQQNDNLVTDLQPTWHEMLETVFFKVNDNSSYFGSQSITGFSSQYC